jgi:hypothetical protein
MQGDNKERWGVLCEQAAVEQDPVKLLKLVTEVNQLLLTKERQLLKDLIPDKLASANFGRCYDAGCQRSYSSSFWPGLRDGRCPDTIRGNGRMVFRCRQPQKSHSYREATSCRIFAFSRF